MTYLAFTRRSGTPLSLKGPVMRRTPWPRCLRRTTRFPRKRPARRMRTVPGSRVGRSLAGWTVLRTCISPIESVYSWIIGRCATPSCGLAMGSLRLCVRLELPNRLATCNATHVVRTHSNSPKWKSTVPARRSEAKATTLTFFG
jgi:hypothetical protein